MPEVLCVCYVRCAATLIIRTVYIAVGPGQVVHSVWTRACAHVHSEMLDSVNLEKAKTNSACCVLGTKFSM